jgi:hypothetical protein
MYFMPDAPEADSVLPDAKWSAGTGNKYKVIHIMHGG